MPRERETGLRAERKAVADAIQRHLDASGLARKDLIREHLSKSTIEKLFQGDFTDRTLNKIEGILKASFARRPVKTGAAAKAIGGYLFDAVEDLQGDYLCIRPMFSNPTNLSVYIISVSWDSDQNCLVFEERSRADAKYSQKGVVYLPFGTSFMNLVSSSAGNLRTILLSLPDADGTSRGIMSTLSNPKGSIFIPATAPIVLQKLTSKDKPLTGIISTEHECYSQYQTQLASVISEEYGIFAIPQYAEERRKAIAVVKP